MNYGPIQPKKRARVSSPQKPLGWVEQRTVKRYRLSGKCKRYRQWFYCWKEGGETNQHYLNKANRAKAYQSIAAGNSIAITKALLGVKK